MEHEALHPARVVSSLKMVQSVGWLYQRRIPVISLFTQRRHWFLIVTLRHTLKPCSLVDDVREPATTWTGGIVPLRIEASEV